MRSYHRRQRLANYVSADEQFRENGGVDTVVTFSHLLRRRIGIHNRLASVAEADISFA